MLRRSDKPPQSSSHILNKIQDHVPRVEVPQARIQDPRARKSYRQLLEEKLQIKQQELDEISQLVNMHKTKTENLQRKSVEPFKQLTNTFYAKSRDSSPRTSNNSISLQNKECASANDVIERSPTKKEGLKKQYTENNSRTDAENNRYIRSN